MRKLLFWTGRCFWKGAKRFKVDVEGWAEERREGRDILARINPTPLGGVNMFLMCGI